MRVIDDRDTKSFIDAAGDCLVLLTAVRHRDAVRREELETKETLVRLKELGLTMEDALKAARETSEEERAAARKESGSSPSPAIRRFMLEAVAVRLTIGGVDYTGPAILDAYDRMDPESAAWVDEQVAMIWNEAVPGEEQRLKRAASAGPA